MLGFFHIGFLDVAFVDLLDIAIVGLLLYQVYRLVRGSLAYNILIGLLLVYLASLAVRSLEMELLSSILGQFVGVGVIAVLIVFQPEIRRFLLFLGRSGRFNRESILARFTGKVGAAADREIHISEIIRAVDRLADTKTGALIVYAVTSRLQYFANTGTIMESRISTSLLQSIFFKNNPLHDGAVIIAGDKIEAAGCVLPISENSNLRRGLGLRHRAAVGITENSDAVAIVVSEERGLISYAREGKIVEGIRPDEVGRVLHEALGRKSRPQAEAAPASG